MRVLVTGGAKRVGAAIVHAVAAAGHVPVIHYRTSQDEAQALATMLGTPVVQGDLADTDAIPALFDRAVAAAGGAIDAVVNCASLFEEDRADAIDAALAARLYAVNTLAPARLCAALAAHVGKRRGEGAVVNLLDQKLANPNPDFFSYTLTKYALAGATTLLAQAFAPALRVNAVAPGLTLPSGEQTAEQFAQVAGANLLHRPVGADQVAAAAVYLLSARSVTGQTLYVDSGQRFVRSPRDVMFEGS